MSTTFMSAQFIMLSSKQMVPYTQREVKVTCRAWRSVNKNLFAVPLSMPLPPRGGASFSENQQTIKIALTHCWDRVGESREAIPKQWRRSEGGSFWKCLNGTRSRELNCHRSPQAVASVAEMQPMSLNSSTHLCKEIARAIQPVLLEASCVQNDTTCYGWKSNGGSAARVLVTQRSCTATVLDIKPSVRNQLGSPENRVYPFPRKKLFTCDKQTAFAFSHRFCFYVI